MFFIYRFPEDDALDIVNKILQSRQDTVNVLLKQLRMKDEEIQAVQGIHGYIHVHVQCI